MDKKLYTDEEMSKQWDELEAAWVILAEWAREEGHQITPIKMRPKESVSPLEQTKRIAWREELGRKMVQASKRMETDKARRAKK